MSKHIKLTPEQFLTIRKTYSEFDQEELPYEIETKLVDESVGDSDRAFSLQIQSLEVQINGQMHKIASFDDSADGALFELASEQFDRIRNRELNRI
jgi:hypothetical protein